RPSRQPLKKQLVRIERVSHLAAEDAGTAEEVCHTLNFGCLGYGRLMSTKASHRCPPSPVVFYMTHDAPDFKVAPNIRNERKPRFRVRRCSTSRHGLQGYPPPCPPPQ